MKRREQRATWFKCFLSSKATIDAVPDENVGKGLKAAFAYFEHKTIPELDPLSNVVLCYASIYRRGIQRLRGERGIRAQRGK